MYLKGKNKPMRTLLLAILCFLTFSATAQDIYKTPSGKKYHLESCRMVNNVSEKVTLRSAAEQYGLSPCKICHPPIASSYGYNTITTTSKNKAQGTDSKNQCHGTTKAGFQCRHYTSIGNDYCYQHNPDGARSKTSSTKRNYNSSYRNYSKTTTSLCGARTKSGSSCKRKVKGGGRCYQH